MYKLYLFDMDGVLLHHKSSWRYCQETIGCECSSLYDEFKGDFLYDKDLNESVMEQMTNHGFNQNKLHELAKNAPQIKGISKVLEAVRACDGAAIIISGGIGAFARELIQQYPFASYYSNELIFNGSNQPPKWEIGVGYYEKGKIARSIQALMGVSKEETMAVGDNSNDCTMFAEAGLSIAFNGNDDAKNVAKYHVDSDDLTDILPIIYGNTRTGTYGSISDNLLGQRLNDQIRSECVIENEPPNPLSKVQ